MAERHRDALSRCRPKRGSFRSIVDPQATLNRYIADHPKPSTRTKPPDQVLAK